MAFGTLAILAKLAYRVGATPLPLLTARFAVTALLLGIYHLATRRPLVPSRSRVARLTVIGGLGYAFEAWLFFLALERAPAAVVGLIFYSFPLWTTILALAARLERLSARLVIALLIGMAGVAFIFSLPEGGGRGALLALGAALAVAVHFIVLQVLLRDVPPALGAVWTATGAAIGLLVATFVTAQPLPVAALPAAVALGIATSVAFVALYEAIGRIGSTRSSVAGMVEPVTTVVLAAVILGEPLAPRLVVGTALIAASLPVLASTPPTHGRGSATGL